jgi:murein DD-endopeptidase MepM/ murein hydrolase activator NlpD
MYNFALMKKLCISYIGLLLVSLSLFIVACGGSQNGKSEDATADSLVHKDTVWKYGLPIEEYSVEYDTIRQGQVLAEMLLNFGMTATEAHELTQCPDTVFDVKRLKPGQVCAFLKSNDSLALPKYFVYEENAKEYVRFDLQNNYRPFRGTNPSEWRESQVAGKVNTSLWVAIQESGTSPMLAVMLSHIFGWTVDFFDIQKGDEFRFIYAQEFVEEKPLNNYKVLAASFKASDSLYYAIPFVQENEELYYNIDGKSLEGTFLKAPLDFYRISSRFSNSRFHPVLKRHRAHHGVDYAAPTGTPVYAIGSGKVIAKAYQRGGAGNYLKIRHNSTYTTTYMHLSRFAKGLRVGDEVAQKEVVGYVGSTGLSTGPHLDFRIYENGRPVNPLKVKSEPKKPISKENKEAFSVVRDSLVGRLKAIKML